MSELISIIIPVYNVAEYLPQCLDSVLSQTYRNLEIIAIDDGSTDESGNILDQYAEKDSRIRVIHKPNGGVSSARNVGLKAATGDYIGFIDADDWIEPDMYEKLERILRENDAAICGFFDYPYGMSKPIPRGRNPVQKCGFEEAVIQVLSRDGYYVTLWNKAFRRHVVEGIAFDTALSFGEDEVWLMQALRRCKGVTFLPEPLYHWRKREGSVTRFSHITDRQLSLLEAKKKSFDLLPDRKDIAELAKSKMFNDCFFIKLQAYCTRDRKNYHLISDILKPVMHSWLMSNDTPKLRKAKVLIMDMEMKLKFSPEIVKFTDNVKKMHR
ncbi:MAG: glycosyltransferase family 2 protein [bacterium]